MNKLLTAGCSFTKHCWPTWADYLSNNFDWHVQLGIGGADNASIARSVVSATSNNDTVVIMWSGYDRWSFYDNEWKHRGCLVTNKHFYVNHYNPIERFATTMDYVQMVDNHAKLNNYTCYHFSAFPWLQSELKNKSTTELLEIYDSYNINNNFLMDMDLLSMQENNNEVFVINHKYIKHDTHPTPITHWKFLNEIIAPNTNITIDQTTLEQVNLDQKNVLLGNIN